MSPREDKAGTQIVIEITFKDSSQMLLSQHDHVIQAFALDGAHQPFRKRVLPRALRCGQDFGGAHVSEAIAETFAVDQVPISKQISWRRVVGEHFQDLLSGQAPVGCSVTLKYTTRRRWGCWHHTCSSYARIPVRGTRTRNPIASPATREERPPHARR
jgi:hypothetical protein